MGFGGSFQLHAPARLACSLNRAGSLKGTSATIVKGTGFLLTDTCAYCHCRAAVSACSRRVQILPIESLRVRLLHRPTIRTPPGMTEFMPGRDFSGQRPKRTRRYVTDAAATDDRVRIEREPYLRGIYQHTHVAVPGVSNISSAATTGRLSQSVNQACRGADSVRTELLHSRHHWLRARTFLLTCFQRCFSSRGVRSAGCAPGPSSSRESPDRTRIWRRGIVH